MTIAETKNQIVTNQTAEDIINEIRSYRELVAQACDYDMDKITQFFHLSQAEKQKIIASIANT